MSENDRRALRIAASIVEDLPYVEPVGRNHYETRHCRLTTLAEHLREMAEDTEDR